MSTFLETIEKRIQSLLEDGLDRLLHPGASQSLSTQLLKLIQDNIRQEKPRFGLGSHQKVAPDLITLFVPTERWDAWQSMRTTLKEVAREIETSFEKEGYHFEHHPRIHLRASEKLALDKIEITTSYQREIEETGHTTLLETHTESFSFAIPPGAGLILNGKDTLKLEKAIVHIGRHSNNDIVIQDPMVSRDHLQLRAQRGRYLLFDLSSTGGTLINGQAVHHAILKPGDVIRIGQTVLIYNQDVPEATTKTIVSLAD